MIGSLAILFRLKTAAMTDDVLRVAAPTVGLRDFAHTAGCCAGVTKRLWEIGELLAFGA
jgi:hypothetical protein